MVRKTKKQSKKKQSGIHSIPELRRAFEYIEEYVDNKIHQRETKENLIKSLRKEWRNVFTKELSKVSADAFITDRMSHIPHKTLRRQGGGSLGAPLGYDMRPGGYLASGGIPDANGNLSLNGAPYGSYTQYVSAGFVNPEIGQSFDPIKGQAAFPIPYQTTGSNQAGGKRNRTRKGRKTRGGGILDTTGAFLSQAFSRPIPSAAPPIVAQDMQDMWHGKQVGYSPDQVQRHSDPQYLLGTVYPKAINIPISV